MKNYQKIFLLLSLVIFTPIIGFADGGGPILLIINAYVFLMGQAWILLSEYFYLAVLLKPISFSKRKIFKITFIINLLSTIIGAFFFPFLLALVTLPGIFYMETKWGGLLMALGTWVAGDNSPYSEVAMGATIAGFIVTFILTVWVENKYLNHTFKKQQITPKHNLFKHCIFFNLISYAGLIILFFGFSYLNSGRYQKINIEDFPDSGSKNPLSSYAAEK